MIRNGKILVRMVILVLTLVGSGCAGSPAVPLRGQETLSGGQSERQGDGSSFENNYRVGISSLEEGNLEEARVLLELLGREMPETFEVRNALGVLYRRLGQTEKAISEYRAAVSLVGEGKGGVESPGLSAHLHNNLGIALREKGDFKEAEKSYQKAIRLDSRFPDPYYNLGVLYDLYMGRAPEALEYYKKFLKLSGKDKEVELWVKDLEQQQKRPGKKKSQ